MDGETGVGIRVGDEVGILVDSKEGEEVGVEVGISVGDCDG